MSLSDTGQAGPRLAVGIDIGGTKIAAGVVDDHGAVVETIPPVSTPTDQADVVAALTEVVNGLKARYPGLMSIGVGAAGIIEWPSGLVRWAPNNGYRSMELKRILEKASGLPVVVDNDANVAAWAEARLGRSADYLLFLTVGTGVGGGVVLGRRLFRGASGIGAEIGHIVVDARGQDRCGCGIIGCLEAVASGSALGRYGREAAAADPDGTLAKMAGGAAKVSGEIVYRAALEYDPTALSLYARLGEWLGIGLASLATIFDLEVIVIGGGVAIIGEPLMQPIRQSLAKHLFAAEHRTLPEIRLATLGVEAGWIGAAILSLDEATRHGLLPGQRDEHRESAPAADVSSA